MTTPRRMTNMCSIKYHTFCPDCDCTCHFVWDCKLNVERFLYECWSSKDVRTLVKLHEMEGGDRAVKTTHLQTFVVTWLDHVAKDEEVTARAVDVLVGMIQKLQDGFWDREEIREKLENTLGDSGLIIYEGYVRPLKPEPESFSPHI